MVRPLPLELACAECGELIPTMLHEDHYVARTELVAHHALSRHSLPTVDLALCWTAMGLRTDDAARCAEPWCYRPTWLHPSLAEQLEATALVAELADPPVAWGAAGIQVGPRSRRALERAAAQAVADGGHWILPLVRVRPVARHQVGVVRAA